MGYCFAGLVHESLIIVEYKIIVKKLRLILFTKIF